ncbi:MAG: hypothetical protein H6624_06370 [Bdellovibrionaceae bacterium]|nr:hypothetical protein [Bdellovibrionales bacterium]MCB9083948.1 hypothetical protein [Pseudobdellovibrionaceae bacterium]
MKAIIGMMAMALVLVSAKPASACSMAPLDVDKVLAMYDLQAGALAALQVSADKVTSVDVSDKDGNYIWNNPMCPEGHWVSATYTVTFDAGGGLGDSCLGVAKVKREKAAAVNFRAISVPAIDRMTVDVIQSPVCTASM